MRSTIASAVAVWCLASVAAAGAQSGTGGNIAGTAKDTTGAVLPGVTVEAASPALIEKVRTAVTDRNGEYKIVDLRPGTYTVTFTLVGFASVKREGIELNAGFTAPVNADLKVGSIEETVTVTGASPVVDVQNVRNQTVMTREALDALPAGGKAIQNYAALILGAAVAGAGSQDVGGSKGDSTGGGFGVHGSNQLDSRSFQDGMVAFNALEGSAGPSVRHLYPNPAFMQETVVTVGSASAEIETGGPQMNYIPREGGNRYNLYVNADFTNHRLQANSLPQELQDRGLRAQAKTKTVYDIYPAIGGPIRQDRLWFYAAGRRSVAQEYAPGAYHNATHGTRFYTADLSRPAFSSIITQGVDTRVNWQATSKQKVAFNNSFQANCVCVFGLSATTSPDAAGKLQYGDPIIWFTQTVWTYAASSRLLFDAGGSFSYDPLVSLPADGALVDPVKDVPMFEISTGLSYNSRQAGASLGSYTGSLGSSQHVWGQRFGVSYITGSHAFKVGVSLIEGDRNVNVDQPNPIRYEFLNGTPNRLTLHASPFTNRQILLPNMGIYVQDQWTLRRFTINAGARMDVLRSYVPALRAEAGPFVPARDYPAVHGVPTWFDVSPRLGVAYDLFGNGKTALKASLGRFMAQDMTGFAALNAPSNQIVPSVTRQWTDTNGNFVPDCNLASPLLNGECGIISNSRFGTAVPTASIDPVLKTDHRSYSWQGAVNVQHELRPGLALFGGYFRTSYGSFWAQLNRAVASSDYDPYCITAPTDARLGDVSGQRICGLFDVNRARFGQVDNLVSPAEAFGTPSLVYNGFDLGLNARFGNGGFVQGGINLGQSVQDVCLQNAQPNVSVVSQGLASSGGTVPLMQGANTPRTDAYCHVESPWTAGSQGLQVKFSGRHPLPWGLQASATLQNLPGVARTATYTATNAQIVPSLGRNLAACGAAVTCTATVSVPIVIANTALFEDRMTQIDVRLSKSVRLGRTRMQGMVDVYNLLNATTILGSVGTYGPSFGLPTAVLGARLVKFGVQLDY